MYSEWVAIQVAAQAEERRWSVLHKFPGSAGRDVVLAVVRPLAGNLGISTASCEPSTLKNEKEVQWCMEVICYGLGLPLTDHEAIRDCVNVYCEWLLALTKPKACVPLPVCDSPNTYARKMIDHLYNLFVPRSESTNDIISRQAVLCHRVLRTLETLAQDSCILERETWDAILLFLLAINDTLLSPPSVQDDISSKLCERILSVLFEVWLLACRRCFPSPALWKTFRELCCSWRHRVALVDQWNRITLALNARLLVYMYGTHLPEVRIAEEDQHLVPPDAPPENVAQAWFRLLHTLGNPVELCKPEVISQTPKFYHFALSSEMVIDPCQHPCLAALPNIFHKAMKGLATLTDSFLGIAQLESSDDHSLRSLSSHGSSYGSNNTPPHQRRNVARSITKLATQQRNTLIAAPTVSRSTGSSPATTPTAPPLRPPPSPSRPKCNSVLHLLGAWLFEAALIGSGLSLNKTTGDTEGSGGGGGVHRRPSSLVLEGKGSTPSMPDSIEIPSNLTLENFEAGQAEAAGALCRIFCAKRTGEDVLPVYLARFYLAVQFGLSGGKSSLGQVMSCILLNSCDLLCQDLEGIAVLLPYFLSALELVLPEREPKLKPQPTIPQVDLRRASIHILLSVLALPLHFKDLHIKELCASANKPTTTFQSLRPRLMNLLMNALQVENDPANTQMLLGGLLQSILDAAALEEVEQFTQQAPHDLTPSESVAVLLCSDSAYALFVRATYLVCHRLISTWKADLNVSLAALEVLSGLAAVHLPQQVDSQECKRAVKWICDYIVYQCSRPPPAHSKDLHSTIVAAYHCLTVWLTEHPCLLRDRDSVHVVLEVVELGISGSKSQGKSSDAPKLKADKELKPASLRVKDAAEVVLTTVMDRVGYFPPPCGPETLSSLLDEESLLQHCNGGPVGPREEAVRSFRYFVLDNGIILALLEQHLGNDQDPQPTVTALVRGPFGRHSWAMQMRQLPRSKVVGKPTTVVSSRPVPTKNTVVRHAVRHRYFPDSMGRITPCRADSSIPSLDQAVIGHEGMRQLIQQQLPSEEGVLRRPQVEGVLAQEEECQQPELCHEFQTARLFLSHLGSLSLEALQETLTQPLPSLMELDQGQPGFSSHLESLDAIGSRMYDTVFVFYVKSGQKEAQEILGNVVSIQSVHPHFLEFLLSLGWPVDVAEHSGWTGHTSTSWRSTSPVGNADSNQETRDHGGCLYDGRRQVLYWASATNEVAFVVPSPGRRHVTEECGTQVTLRNKARLDANRSSMDDSLTVRQETLKPRTLSLNLEQEGLVQGQGRSSGRKFGREAKVLVVWLENFEDHPTFPLDDLLPETCTGCENSVPSRGPDVFVIFIHTLHGGLFRIKMQGSVGRISLALPLVDGMVVSRRALGTLVRQTSVNLCRRRRLDTDSHLPPHVRRRLKIQEIVEKYRLQLPEPEFFTSLFCPMPAADTAV